MDAFSLLTAGEILLRACAITLAVLTLPTTVELAAVSFGAAFSRSRRSVDTDCSLRLAVVIPAHDEEFGIAQCLESVFASSRRVVGTEVVVIADNCTDRTAEIAGGMGARVLRRLSEERGKGSALRYAFETLAPERFDGYLVVDADSVVSPNFVSVLGRSLADGADAAQCLYRVKDPGASTRTGLMNLAFLAFNFVRPSGRAALGLSAGVVGNGFALSRKTLEVVPYESRSIVEDLEYHLMLVEAGLRVRFAAGAVVWGEIPVSGSGVRTQRSRWEGGRLQLARKWTPRLLRKILTGQIRCVEPLLDLLSLPLAFYALLLMILAVLPVPAVRLYALVGILIASLHLGVAILRSGNARMSLATLARVPSYIFWKLTTLPGLFRAAAGRTAWVRTERANAPASGKRPLTLQ